MNEILRLSSLGKKFGGTHVLQDVSVSLAAGERLAVLGASGSGKTTLLRLIAGLEEPTQGEIVIAGKLVSRPGQLLVAPERREVALVFQGLALFPQLRALDQVAFAARGRGGRKRAEQLLECIGLAHRAHARLDELSGGERQRIALARALAQEPKLILLDEPFASLDDDKRSEMRDLLRTLLANGASTEKTTLILVTHSRDDAFDLARSVLVLHWGRPAAHDLLETVLQRPQHAAAVRALGLGQMIEGKAVGQDQVETVFGTVCSPTSLQNQRMMLLVRPSQPCIVAEKAGDSDGVEAEVVSLEVRQSDGRDIRRAAVVRAADTLLRVLVREHVLAVGQKVRVSIQGPCESIAADG